MKLTKKKTIFLAVILSLICIGSIAAYMTSAAKIDNILTVGYNDIDIVEKFDPPPELRPGVEFTKTVSVSNTGPVDCYVRVLSLFSNSDMGDHCTIDYNEKDWAYNETDQYWYYKKPLPAGETTTPLFTKIKLDDDINANDIKDFDVMIYAESYQANGEFDNYQDAWKHYQSNKLRAQGKD